VRPLLPLLALLVAGATSDARAENGYDLWLRYRPVRDRAVRDAYRSGLSRLVMAAPSPTLQAAREELTRALRRMLESDISLEAGELRDGMLIVGTPATTPLISVMSLGRELAALGREGFIVRATTIAGKRATVIAANTDVGVLYGVFRFLRELQMERPLSAVAIASAPRVELRMLDHWDNLDRSVERGYAGSSLWEWDQLPRTVSPRYRDYAGRTRRSGSTAAC
jgi:alpha-glucuronidase